MDGDELLARKVASCVWRKMRHLSYADLVQHAAIGLWQCADPDPAIRFTTARRAVWNWLRAEEFTRRRATVAVPFSTLGGQFNPPAPHTPQYGDTLTREEFVAWCERLTLNASHAALLTVLYYDDTPRDSVPGYTHASVNTVAGRAQRTVRASLQGLSA